MPLNIATAESAYLGGSTRWDDWLTEFEFEWNKPMLEAAIGELMRDIDPQTRGMLEKIIPQEMRELDKKYGG